jgi:hypothetical protein
MARRLDEITLLPRPVLARRLAAQIGRSFSEVIHELYRFGDDVEAVVRHFDAEEGCHRRDETAQPEPPKFEPIVICKSEGELIIVDPPSNAAVIDEMVSRGVLAPATIRTVRGVRTIYASPGFASYLNATIGGEEREHDGLWR